MADLLAALRQRFPAGTQVFAGRVGYGSEAALSRPSRAHGGRSRTWKLRSGEVA